TMFRGVNGFGKVTLIPIEQIASTSIASGNSSITINQMGKKHKFYWLINNTLLCETINNIKAGKFESEKPEQPSNSVYETNPVGDDNNKTIAESAEEVKQLKALLDDGVITEEEFNSKKKQILNL
ncbi:MAG: SHOCT domain-containing protein, partial [Acutalibacteraceae bacterium]